MFRQNQCHQQLERIGVRRNHGIDLTDSTDDIPEGTLLYMRQVLRDKRYAQWERVEVVRDRGWWQWERVEVVRNDEVSYPPYAITGYVHSPIVRKVNGDEQRIMFFTDGVKIIVRHSTHDVMLTVDHYMRMFRGLVWLKVLLRKKRLEVAERINTQRSKK